MSLQRLVFYSALIGGWAAFVGWLLSEIIFLHRSLDIGFWAILLTAALVGALIGGSLNLLGGVASGTLSGQWRRLPPGLLGGFLGGAFGGGIGNLIYLVLPVFIFRALGWTLMGMGIGVVEGVYDRSPRKIRNGLIGGAVGGLLGGLLFDPAVWAIGGIMSSRAAGFVILGLCIGLFVGLAQLVFKQAWLTVETGFRPGRQLILSVDVTVLGTSEKAQLPFIAYGAKGVEPIHLRIHRQPDGAYLLEDPGSRTGTFVNGTKVAKPVLLRNNDVIQLGPNVVRFREVIRHVPEGDLVPVEVAAVAAPKPPPLPRSSPPPLPAAASPLARAKAPVPARPVAAPSPVIPVGRPAPIAKPPAPQPAAIVAKPALVSKAPPAREKTCLTCGRAGKRMPSGKFYCENCDLPI